ncbi:hypothetical protein Ocin01_19050 [Orchesella cincta]|uniref:Transposase domain-containing protein n=1 Tax=Orchesella cincta TaxID=48709 RepID=A0A1D2M3X6_ORCCI|nr:hypothetical protein Ocin01_19050 [Orchesella cincta]
MSQKRKVIVGRRRIQQIAAREVALAFSKSTENKLYANQTSTDSEHTDNESDIKPFNLLESLKEWALTHGINHSQFSSLLKLLRRHDCHQTFPADSRSVIKAHDKVVEKCVEPGKYVHFHLYKFVESYISRLPEVKQLALQINIDGLPLFKSSAVHVWPILGYVVGVSCEPFVIGLYCGSKKPGSVNKYLEQFVQEFISLKEKLLLRNIDLQLHSFICDAPAKAFIKGIKGHTGYFGCDKCEVEGEYINNRVVYLKNNARERDDISFRTRRDDEHHLQTTVLEEISTLDMIKCFPADYMHLICLGVVRKLLTVWIKGKPSSHKLSGKKISELSDVLISYAPHIVSEFQRKPRWSI